MHKSIKVILILLLLQPYLGVAQSTNEMLETALRHVGNLELDSAMELVEKVLKAEPNNSRAHAVKGRIYYGTKTTSRSRAL